MTIEELSVRAYIPTMDWHAGLSVVFFEQAGEIHCMPEYRFLPEYDTEVLQLVINLGSGSYKKFAIVPPLRDEIGIDSLVCIKEGSRG